MSPLILHLARRDLSPALFPAEFLDRLRTRGDVRLIPQGEEMSREEALACWRSADILLTGWTSLPLAAELAENPGRLRYICHLTGEMRTMIPLALIRSAVTVTNWGHAPAKSVAEGAVTLLLACLKNLGWHVQARWQGNWKLPSRDSSGSLQDLNVGLYGLGYIGRETARLLTAFGTWVWFYDPFVADAPAGWQRVESLEQLFRACPAISLHAGLTPDTRQSVDARLLALLPDHGVIVNTARGGLIDQEALFAELASGRLRAGLDTIDDDWLPPDHPAMRWPNLILTGHRISSHRWQRPHEFGLLHQVALDNIDRFLQAAPLDFVMDETRYERST